MIKRIALLAAIVICFGQCKTNSSSTASNSNSQDTSLRTPISRGTIRVLAQIVEIKSSNSDTDSPCGSNPCIATIKIEDVIDTGSFFEGEVNSGQSLDAYFVKTLMPTENIFPELQQHLPGLKVNDKFQADIVYNQKSNTTSKYHVVTYKKQ